MARLYTDPIPETDCIGDSLQTINDNFENLDVQAQTQTQNYYVTYACEVSGSGSVGRVMSYGAGATSLSGLRMLYDGQLLAASLQCTNVAGEIIVDAYLNGTAQTNYRLSYSSDSGLNGGQQTTFTPSLSFFAGDTLGWIQRTLPLGGANSFAVNYLVKYTP